MGVYAGLEICFGNKGSLGKRITGRLGQSLYGNAYGNQQKMIFFRAVYQERNRVSNKIIRIFGKRNSFPTPFSRSGISV